MHTSVAQQRLEARRLQSTMWSGPLCDVTSLPRADGGLRPRSELDTRGTINNRFWSDLMSAGAKQVTSEMLAAHPTHGAQDNQPTLARQDKRQWSAAGGKMPAYFPDERGAGERPRLPDSSLWRNPHFDGWNPESIDTMREMRQIVSETNAWTLEDASIRAQQRTWQHQWLPGRGVAQLEAAERLRSVGDDYRIDFRHANQTEQE